MPCDGLPLSLKVVGKLLCGENDKSQREDELDRCEQVCTKICMRLKISY